MASNLSCVFKKTFKYARPRGVLQLNILDLVKWIRMDGVIKLGHLPGSGEFVQVYAGVQERRR